jgi:hypothetical protein
MLSNKKYFLVVSLIIFLLIFMVMFSRGEYLFLSAENSQLIQELELLKAVVEESTEHAKK